MALLTMSWSVDSPASTIAVADIVDIVDVVAPAADQAVGAHAALEHIVAVISRPGCRCPSTAIRISSPLAPVMRLASSLPTRWKNSVPMKVRFSMKAPRVKSSEEMTVSVPPPSNSVTTS